MKLKKKQAEFAEQLLEWWEDQDLLEPGQSARLKKSLELKSINWRKIAKYLMGLAVASIIIAFLQLVADEWILQILEKLFRISDFALFCLLLVLSAVFYFFGARVNRKTSNNVLSKNALYFLGAVAFGGALHYFGASTHAEGFWEVALILFFSLHTFIVAASLKSILFYDLAWLALLLWLGLESSRQTGWEGTWLGMNLPLRYFIFSWIALLTSFLLARCKRCALAATQAQTSGWVVFWVSLWLVSLFGNHISWEVWEEQSALNLLPWGLFMAAVSGGFWLLGSRLDKRLYVWFGIGGLLAVGYTQFFHFLWDTLHPALFFTLLGASFWLLGRKVEMF